MKKVRKTHLLALLLLWLGLILLLAGCQKKVAATVNGQPIYADEIDRQVNTLKQQQPQAFSGAQGQEQEKRFRQGLIDFLVNNELIRQEAKRLGVTVGDKEINERIAQIKKLFPNEKQFNATLKQTGISTDDLRQKVIDDRIRDKMHKKITSGVKVTDADVKDSYEENKAQFEEPETYKLRHIVVKEQSEADGLVSRLRDGADFSEEAKKSLDTSTKDNGGDLGWKRKDQLPPEAVNAFSGLSFGQVSSAVKGTDGYHIFKLEDKKPPRQKSFEEVKSQIEQRLLNEKQGLKFSKWVQELRRKATVKTYS